MIRCLKTTFYASYETIDRLFDCNRVSAEVWNHCLALAKEKHLKTGEWVTKSELQKATKELYLIHSQLFKQFAINIFTLENPHMPQEELASTINIHINKRKTSIPNGQIMASKYFQMEKSNCLWVFWMGNVKNLSSFG